MVDFKLNPAGEWAGVSPTMVSIPEERANEWAMLSAQAMRRKRRQIQGQILPVYNTQKLKSNLKESLGGAQRKVIGSKFRCIDPWLKA